jgi:O-antigen ligase
MPPTVTPTKANDWEEIYAGLVGLFIALALIKWGNPVIMDAQIATPLSYWELALAPWPVSWAYRLALVVLLGSLFFAKNVTGVSRLWLALPLVWFGLQILSAFFAVDSNPCWMVIPHFGVAVAMFFIGVYCLPHITRVGPFWMALVGAFVVLVIIGLRQQFGGLEETRRFLYSLPNWQELPSEFLQKIASNRIYSTLVYPNAFAGTLLLLTPISMLWMARAVGGYPAAIRWIVLASAFGLSTGCLYWSGSKAGWLIALIQILAGLSHLKTTRRLKVCLLFGLLVAGVVGFCLKYQGYFERGATSVTARLDYWRSAWITIKEFPVLGSGPGSFMVRYKELKDPTSEMTRLAHNDYLQQAADSGVVAGLAFLAFWTVGIVLLYRNSGRDWVAYSVFLGLLGVGIQGFVEFGLYIPAVSWPSWLLLGWFVARGNRIDKAGSHS